MTDPVLHWHIGHNVPGYLPESDVRCFEGTAAEAAKVVGDDSRNAADSVEEAHSTECDLCSAGDWDKCPNRPYLDSTIDGLDSYLWEPEKTHDLGVHFWAVPVDNCPGEDL